MNTRKAAIVFPVVLAAVTALLLSANAFAQSEEKSNSPPHGNLWTYEESLEQLKLYPQDVCLQYIAMKLAQREGLDPWSVLGSEQQQLRQMARERQEDVDLFNIFSGALAVQESLQLDAMRFQGDVNAEVNPVDSVRVSDLQGPTVKSHPWEEMLAGRKPEMSPLANFVPDDHYLVSFRSVGKMLDLVDTGDLFAKHLLSQSGEPAWKRDTELHLKRQLAIETNPLARPFYDLVVKEIVLTGSDPFVNEGSDVTLLFQFDQPLVFKTQMDAYLKSAEKAVPGVVRKEDKWHDLPYVHLTSPDRTVHVYSAYPQKGLHIRSNSLTAFQRILDLVAGEMRDDLKSLGQSTEFAYIRTLMPYGAPEEDGLIYLSDPFIRRLVGPQVKLTELRRLQCFNHLKMIEYSAAMFQAEQGRAAKTLDEMTQKDCLPNGFGIGTMRCPCGGKHSLSADGSHGVCSHHGHSERMIPCGEIPLTKVTESEAQTYRTFETQYSQYWRTFFDPIAIRIQSSPEKYRVETIVLPLIENSIYQSLAMTLGGKPRIQGDSTTSDTILSLDFAIDKPRLLQMSGWHPPVEVTEESPPEQVLAAAQQQSIINLKQIGLAMHNYHDVYNHFPAAASIDGQGKSLLSWRVQLLPYLDQAELYNRFHMDEPWDSPHNIKLVGQMPPFFRAAGDKTLKPGMTTYLTVVDNSSVFPPDGKTTALRDLTDGTSNTLMVIDAAVENAVTWTKPDDIQMDVEVLQKALKGRFQHGGLVALCDGSVGTLIPGLTNETLLHLCQRNDGKAIGEFIRYSPSRSVAHEDPFGLQEITGGRLTEKDLYEFIAQGLGDTYSLHLCDSEPMLDLQMTSMLGQMFGSMGRGRLDSESVMIGMAVASINSPVYVTASIDDAEAVDHFLEQLDDAMSEVARTPVEAGFFRLEKDFYNASTKTLNARTFVISLGPVKWRFFYARIGQQLCVSSKLSVLEELASLEAAPQPDPAVPHLETPAHARLTMHRSHWNKILPSVRMGWNESARHACLDNLGHFATAARTLKPGSASKTDDNHAKKVVDRAGEIYGVHHFCPAGGHYMTGTDNPCECSIHGSARHPKQPPLDETTGVAQQMLTSFDDMRIMLTFLEDGLHAVLEIDKQPPLATGVPKK